MQNPVHGHLALLLGQVLDLVPEAGDLSAVQEVHDQQLASDQARHTPRYLYLLGEAFVHLYSQPGHSVTQLARAVEEGGGGRATETEGLGDRITCALSWMRYMLRYMLHVFDPDTSDLDVSDPDISDAVSYFRLWCRCTAPCSASASCFIQNCAGVGL